MAMKQENLAIFDFDHTIIDTNSDMMVLLQLRDNAEMKQAHDQFEKNSDAWLNLMNIGFNLLHREGIKISSLKTIISLLKPLKHMPKLIRKLSEELNYDVIIVSDANTLFIDWWLEKNNLKQYIHTVFTNPASLADDGNRIELKPLVKNDFCKLCHDNICKGHVVKQFMEGKNYTRVIYAGDGQNDFCPVSKLRVVDMAFARDGFPLAEIFEGVRKVKKFENVPVVCGKYIFKTGNDILDCVEKCKCK